jgi:hypothetical protein
LTDVRELRAEHPQIDSRLWYGYFAKDMDDISEGAMIIIPDFDKHQDWGPAFWSLRPHDTYPQKGDECLVAFDNRMQVWVVSWWSGRPWIAET